MAGPLKRGHAHAGVVVAFVTIGLVAGSGGPQPAVAGASRYSAPDLQPLATTRAVAAPSFVPLDRLKSGSSLPELSPSRKARWRHDVTEAAKYANGRLGRVAFAVVDDGGNLHGYHAGRRYYSASVVKAMLLVAYLRRREVRTRRLGRSSRDLLRPMIERSDNNAASRVFSIVGGRRLARLARRAGMRRFVLAPAGWADTQISAGDQARFFFDMDSLVPERHRGYARYLLSHVVSYQRWGVARALPRGARIYFKGGWRPERGGGWLVHQAARVELDGRRAAVAVLTNRDRSEGYGHETIRGVAARALRALPAER